MRYLVLFLSFLVFSSGINAAEEEGAESTESIEYLEMKPKFTVNLDKPNKYLVVNVQLMVEGQKYIEKIKKHLPALRHELIMIYSGIPAASIETMEQRESLRQKSKEVITQALEKHSNSDGFRDVYFTEFLVN